MLQTDAVDGRAVAARLPSKEVHGLPRLDACDAGGRTPFGLDLGAMGTRSQSPMQGLPSAMCTARSPKSTTVDISVPDGYPFASPC